VRREKQSFDEIVANLSPIESAWMDDLAGS
jgi:hypothetical protein